MPHNNMKIFGGLALVLALAGCAEQKQITEEELQRPVEIAPAVPTTVDDATDTGLTDSESDSEEADSADADQSANPPELEPITFSEIVDIVEPGLGCSFIVGDDDSLLFATGDDGAESPIQAAVKVRGIMVPLIGRGGYSALEAGTTLTSEALEVTVERSQGEGETVGVETLEWSATMTVVQDEGGSRSYDGRYSCGA